MITQKALNFTRFICVCLLLVSAAMFTLNPAWAASDAAYESFKRNMSSSPDIPWDLEADSVFFDRNTNTYAAEGRAILSQPGRKIIADYLEMNRSDMKVFARGNVEVYVEDDILKSDAVEIDLTNETGTVTMGYIFIRQSNFHINGSDISKTGPDEYEIIDGSLTSCDGPNPDWRFESSKTEITLDGYGYAYDTVFYVRDFPIFYTPFFAFPVKTSRQSGLLMPQWGASERFGTYITVPFFWAIDEHQDATFYTQYMTKRGLKVGAEYRYDFGDYSGAFQADYLHDLKVDNGVWRDANRYGYNDGRDDAPREDKDRFWLRGTHRQELAQNLRFIVELDYVSDQDYLREFRTGYMSYTESYKFFLGNHYWDMDGKEDFIRTNKVLLNKYWKASSLNAQMVWYDDIIARQTSAKNFTVQKLPSLSYNIRKQKIGDNLPLFFTLNTEYANYWRKDGPSAQRMDMHPRVYAPINFGLFTLEPSVGLRNTSWYQYGDDLANIDGKSGYNRFMLDTRTRLSSQFNRVYDLEGFAFTDISMLKHTITPEIIYDYIPEKDQDKLPYFTHIDRITKRNQVFASFTTAFTTKIKNVAEPKRVPEPRMYDVALIDYEDDENVESLAESQVSFKYLEILRFNLKQGYDFDGTQEGKNDNMMPFYAAVKFQPFNWIRFNADVAWSFNKEEIVKRTLAVFARDNRGDSISLSWRYNDNYYEPYDISDSYPDNMLNRYYIHNNKNLYQVRDKDKTESFIGSANIRITHGIDLFGNTEYNLADKTRVETNLGLRYSEQCWAVELIYRDEKEGGITVGVFVTLLSIGDIGF